LVARDETPEKFLKIFVEFWISSVTVPPLLTGAAHGMGRADVKRDFLIFL